MAPVLSRTLPLFILIGIFGLAKWESRFVSIQHHRLWTKGVQLQNLLSPNRPHTDPNKPTPPLTPFVAQRRLTAQWRRTDGQAETTAVRSQRILERRCDWCGRICCSGAQRRRAAYVRKPSGGMPPYTSKVMSDAELADVRAYLVSIPEPPAVKDIPLLKP